MKSRADDVTSASHVVSSHMPASLFGQIMAAEGIGRTSATKDTLAAGSRGEEVCDEETVVRPSGKVRRQTAAEDIVNSLSLSEHT